MSDEAVELSVEQIKENLSAVDITEDPGWLAAARWEVSVGYSKLASSKTKLRLRDIYAAICEDGYERENRSRTIGVLLTHPKTQSQELAGLVRVVFGRTKVHDADPAPLDIMNFIAPLKGWPAEFGKTTENQFAEMGRFTVIEKFRLPEMREAGIDTWVTRLLFEKVYELSSKRGVRTIYAIMPSHASELVERAGARLIEIPATLNTKDPEAAAVFEKFPLYWKRLTPKLFQFGGYHAETFPTLATIFLGVLRSDQVIASAESIQRNYEKNVSGLYREIPLVLRPESIDDVRGVIRIANEQNLKLSPFSTGKNWGLGSKLPVMDGAIVVDLSRMNRIVKVNEAHAYAILEPGVTQLQLATYLKTHHPNLTMNFTGSFGYTGIVGNVLERGDGGHARVEDLLGVRGVLGNGEPFEAGGVWDYVDTEFASHASRYVAGPDLCGMFAQSNFGIVTQLAFKLMPLPEQRVIVWGSAKQESLEKVVETLARFGKQGVINPGSVNLGYANRFVQGRASMGGASAAPAEEEWNFYVFMGGMKRVVDVGSAALVEALKGDCSRVEAFVVGSSAMSAQSLPMFLHPILKPLTDVPDTETIKMIYQLTGTPIPDDPRELDADQTPFGMKCCIPVVPFTGVSCRVASEVVNKAREKSGLNIKVSFFGDGRTLITIHFRADVQEQVEKAEKCERMLWDELVAAGFPPYRVSIDQMERAVGLRPTFFGLVEQIKRAVDPNNVISPGRYCSRSIGNGV